MDLCPTGDAGFDPLALGIAGDLAAEFLDEDRSFRPWADEAHVAGQDVEELGQRRGSRA